MDWDTMTGAFVARFESQKTRTGYGGDLRRAVALAAKLTSCSEAEAKDVLLRSPMAVVVPLLCNLVAEMQAKGHKPTSLRRWRSAMISFYRFLQRSQARETNPAELIETPKVVFEELHCPVPTSREVKSILVRMPAADRALFGLMASSGLRNRETRTLRWGSFSPDYERVTVLGKGRKYRTVAVASEIRAALRFIREDRGDDAHVFPASNGGAITEDTVRKRLNHFCDLAGVPHYTPHALRRAFATQASLAGVTLEELRLAMGHASPDTTCRYIKRRESNVTVTY